MADYKSQTQSELGAVIKRPKLSDRLLDKPPFGFLHDIVKEVNKATGFGDGLFTDEQWEVDNIKKDKAAKLLFLNTIQQAVCEALGERKYMNPNKVVAGLEPARTNAFLVALARASSQGGGEKPPTESKPKREKREKAKEQPAEQPPRPHAPSPPRSPVVQDTPAAPEPEPEPSVDIPLPTPIARPTSAKKAPEPPAVRTVTTRTVRANVADEKPRAPAAAPVVIEEGDGDEDSDDDIIVEDAPAPGGLDSLAGFGTTMGGGDAMASVDDGEQHGMLVQNLLQAQQDMKVDQVPEGIVMQRDRSAKDKEATRKEIEKLTESLQTLVRSANPLGRAMDYLHEDLESMTKEYEMWRAEARMHQHELTEAQRKTEEALEPSRRELGLLEEKIEEERTKINAMKASVLQGEEKLLKLLRLRTDKQRS